MKKTLQVNIGGRNFYINEDAYGIIREYLDALQIHFAAEGESAKEILEDIEIRIAELFQERITTAKPVITLPDAREIIDTMGNLEDMEVKEKPSSENEYDRKDYRRLFRDPDNLKIAGVASGLAAYFNSDALWIRIAFVLLAFLYGLGLILYAVLWVAVPKARTTAEKLQMQGLPVNLSSIRSSVSEEYRKTVDSIRRSGVGEVIRTTGNIFLFFIKVFVIITGIMFVLIGTVLLTFLLFLFFGNMPFPTGLRVWDGWDLPDITALFSGSPNYQILLVCLIVLILIPVVVVMYEGIKFAFSIKTRHRFWRAFTITAWFLALILLISITATGITNMAVEVESETEVPVIRKPVLHINVVNNTAITDIITYNIFDFRFKYNKETGVFYMKPELTIERTGNENPYVVIRRKARNIRQKDPGNNLEKISYNWETGDTSIDLDRYFSTSNTVFWTFPEVTLSLYLPEGQSVVLSEDACEILNDYFRYRYCLDSSFVNVPVVMTSEGLSMK